MRHAASALSAPLLIVQLAACIDVLAPFGGGNGSAPMNNERLRGLIESISDDVGGEVGYWVVKTPSRQILVVTDEAADRMRIMTPVLEEEDLTTEELKVLLAANFDRALDARYAVARGYLWSVFIHPLGSLTDEQFLDGIQQVETLAENYGGSYSSTDLIFQGGQN